MSVSSKAEAEGRHATPIIVRKRAHGTHEYALEQYGLTPERVRTRLGAYIRRFGLRAA